MGDVVKYKNKEQEENMGDLIDFRQMTGGKEPPADGNWLNQLPNGTIFSVQKKGAAFSQEFSLGEFILMDKTPKSVFVMTPDMPGKRLRWNPVRFCRQYDLWEVDGVLEAADITQDVKEEETCTTSSDTKEPHTQG